MICFTKSNGSDCDVFHKVGWQACDGFHNVWNLRAGCGVQRVWGVVQCGEGGVLLVVWCV